MREIKFRAFKDNQMIEGVQPHFGDPELKTCMVPDSNGAFIHERAGSKGFWFEVPVDAIMQYTGLKDKNGKEIYEGDLLHRHLGVYWKVIFERSQWMTSPNTDSGLYLTANQFAECEIIGNIYEHPELLK